MEVQAKAVSPSDERRSPERLERRERRSGEASLADYTSIHMFKPVPEFDDVPVLAFSQLAALDGAALAQPGTLVGLANLAKDRLLATPADNGTQILDLWALRLAALSLVPLTTVAEQEGAQLNDLGTPESFRGTPTVPWRLRVLLVKIQTPVHGQLGAVKYYALAREARGEAWKVRGTPAEAMWRTRLRACGLYVAAMLVQMKDYGTAADHLLVMLESVPEGDDEARAEVVQALAVVAVTMGDARKLAKWLRLLPGAEPAEPDPDAGPVTGSAAAPLLALCAGDAAPLHALVRAGTRDANMLFNLCALRELRALLAELAIKD
ncbi:uncharacterized protein V1510DRAFT_412930 [Dipodascopsis tothii]|uniref:uncharacterized protein n=1 Tax=Dipodascopsis tothii TaxID=44089 RepID=UPI0034CD18D9